MKKLFGFFPRGEGERTQPKHTVSARMKTGKACRVLHAIPCIIFALFAFLSFVLMATPLMGSSAKDIGALNGDELRRTLHVYWSDTISNTYAGTSTGTHGWTNYYSLSDDVHYTKKSYESENLLLYQATSTQIEKLTTNYLSIDYTRTYAEIAEKLYEEYRALSVPEGLTQDFNALLAGKIAENETKEEDEQKSLSALAADAASELTANEINGEQGKYSVTDTHFPSTSAAYAAELAARDAQSSLQRITSSAADYSEAVTAAMQKNRTAVEKEAADRIAAKNVEMFTTEEKNLSALKESYNSIYRAAQVQMEKLIVERNNTIVQSLTEIERQNDRIIQDRLRFETLRDLSDQYLSGTLGKDEFFDALDKAKIYLFTEIKEDKEKTDKEPAAIGWESLAALLDQYNSQQISYEVFHNRLYGLKDDGKPYSSSDPEEGRNIAFKFSVAPSDNSKAKEFENNKLTTIIQGQLLESTVQSILLAAEVETNISTLRSKIAVSDDKEAVSELDKKEKHTTLFTDAQSYLNRQIKTSSETSTDAVYAQSSGKIAAYMAAEIIPTQGLFYEKETLRTYAIASIVLSALTLVFAAASVLCHFVLADKDARGAKTVLSCLRYVFFLAAILLGVLVIMEVGKDVTGIVSVGIAPILLVAFAAVGILGSMISSALAARASKRHLAPAAPTAPADGEDGETVAEAPQAYAEAKFTQKTKLALRLFHGIALIVFSVIVLTLCAFPALFRTVMSLPIADETSIYGLISFRSGVGFGALMLVLFAAAGIPFGVFILLRNKLNAELKYCSVVLFYVPMLIIMTAIGAELNGFSQSGLEKEFLNTFHIVTYMNPTFAAAYALGFVFLLTETAVLCSEAGFGAWDPFDYSLPPEAETDEKTQNALAELPVPAAVPQYPAFPAFPVSAGYSKEDLADFRAQQVTYRTTLKEWKSAVAERQGYVDELIRYYYLRHLTLKGKSVERVGDLAVWLWWNFTI